MKRQQQPHQQLQPMLIQLRDMLWEGNNWAVSNLQLVALHWGTSARAGRRYVPPQYTCEMFLLLFRCAKLSHFHKRFLLGHPSNLFREISLHLLFLFSLGSHFSCILPIDLYSGAASH